LALPAASEVLAKHAWYTSREEDYRQLEKFLVAGDDYGVYAMSVQGKFLATVATMAIVVEAPLECSHGFAFRFVVRPSFIHYTNYNELLYDRAPKTLSSVSEEPSACSVCKEQN